MGAVSNGHYPRARVRPLLLTIALLSGCESSTRKAAPAEPDRDTTAVVARARAIPAMAARLRPDSQLVPATLGVKLDTPLKGGLDTILPLTARASMRIQRDAAHTLDLSADHANDTKGLIDTGAMVFVQPTADVDVLLITEPTRVTEVRILRSASGPTTATWTVHRGDGVGALRVVGNTIEVPRNSGAVWLASDAIELVDSAGTKRPITLKIEADRIAASYTLEGLRFPAAFALAWNEKVP